MPRGGKRSGAGRKPTGRTPYYSVSVPHETLAELDQWCDELAIGGDRPGTRIGLLLRRLARDRISAR